MERAFPLLWPQGRKRTPAHQVTLSRFDVPPSQAQREMIEEIQRMGGRSIVISTNQRAKLDGTLYAKDLNRTPDDAGVAVYFERKGQRVCFCCDRYHRVWENMRAIGKSIEAMRGIERWGSAEMLDCAFTGFVALPAPSDESEWWNVLGVSRSATVAEIENAYRAKAKLAHPDLGGSAADMAALNQAKDSAMEARS